MEHAKAMQCRTTTVYRGGTLLSSRSRPCKQKHTTAG